uniref:NADH-ubiquinone oxidoreductase chain 3 n=1 Tax=Ettchellsia sinica TaxID=1738633 RepID=A0A2S0B0X7_9HYME|nr:NADH dehydrogenase subunit 3 [Ettchellsia sinica]
MLVYMFYLILLIIMVLMIYLFNYFISKKMLIDREKMSPFECGFSSINNTHFPFSLHFFLVGLIFLIFDIEISLMFPLLYSFNYEYILEDNLIWFYMSNIFFMVLLMGVLYEWFEGSLNWSW